MKAIVQERYGPPSEVLTLQEIDRPLADPHEVLVHVRAVSINVGDYYTMRGVPYLMRPAFGLRRPRNPIPGMDLAGNVEAVGTKVSQFSPGDEVFGWAKCVLAEYVAVGPDSLLPKPTNLSYEQAAALGVSAQTALQALRDHGKVGPGHEVLINGASGGVGTFAVQIAKSRGADVTGVCNTRNVELVTSIGADHVIDYAQEDFTKGDARYDFILDNVGNHSFSDTRRALTPDGRLLSNGAPVAGWIGGLDHAFGALIQSLFARQQLRPFVSLSNTSDLVVLKELAETGKVTPVIDGTYPLSEAALAVSHVGEGHARGKTVITI